MGFHHDAALGHRTTRKPYHPCDWLCSICCKCSTRSVSPSCQRVSTLLLSADLTDVSPDEPAFAVVPRTVRHEPIGRAKVELGADYIEQPLWGPAGTCIFCASLNTAPLLCDDGAAQLIDCGFCADDIATYHTRLDSLTGNDERGRRTMHEYYARGGYLDIPADPNGEWDAQTRPCVPLVPSWLGSGWVSECRGLWAGRRRC